MAGTLVGRRYRFRIECGCGDTVFTDVEERMTAFLIEHRAILPPTVTFHQPIARSIMPAGHSLFGRALQPFQRVAAEKVFLESWDPPRRTRERL